MTKYDLTIPTCRGVDIQDLNIAELQRHMEDGTFTSADLTGCYMQRIKRVNPILK